MDLLTRDAILTADDLSYEDVPVPEWGGTVRVRTLSGTERDAFEASIVDVQGKRQRLNMHNIRAKLAALTIIDAQSARLFSDRDIEALGNKSAAALQRVFEVAQRLNGLSDEDVEELAKN